MGISCCKQVRVTNGNVTRIIADGEKSIVWIKGEKIGSGAFGTVFRAIDTETADYFAVKCIPLKPYKDHSCKLIKLIQKEVNILKTLNHPNIIKYYQTDLDIHNNEISIIIEYASNGNLQTFVSEFKPLSHKVLQRFTREILMALSYMHGKGIIHRDLKCSNILIAEDSSIKLSDFGLSKLIESDDKVLEIAGTLYWMPPEMFTNRGYSFAADVWSLGCTVVEMMTGSPPWANTYKLVKDIIKAITSPNNFPEIPSCSAELKDFLLKCFTRKPEDRPSAEELLHHPFLTDSFSAVITATVTEL
ncbi:hypothetical protein SteCoe_18499 [Stentor coeruleus]|uniref:Protein kinase domain-containing protein n=1 Tax=Stentor coeruleus TaxID=5963 RepID=A0A1R2BWB8_9CILI|nr:hypothetical protein SteCoe_18499 [Stentor coeruleus]